ncbi:MAG TPA: glycosyltransferase family 4 protein [Solirubrobacteraceae bacterium]|nr:glycosyltransferase family 4 protein [Solirubrobacteraceae bacterium]
MTASTEAGSRDSDKEAPLGDAWRAQALAAQRAGLPAGATVLSCAAPLDVGGLGRHLRELADALGDRGGAPPLCLSSQGWAALGRDGALARMHRKSSALSDLLPRMPMPDELLSWLPVPVPPGAMTWAHMFSFDRRASRQLPRADHVIAFNGQALRQMQAARRSGYESLALVSANSHMRQVQRLHAHAHERYPLEGSWASRMLARNLAEYRLADCVYYATDYIRDSFLEQGFPAERLVRFPLTPDPRFAPAASPQIGGAPPSAPTPADASPTDSFELVYVGSLHVHKGVPLLIDAFRRLSHADLRLRLVGGWGSRGMRRFVQRACVEDARIVVSPGDPLPHLRSAALCVHPAYEDGFGYAPAEAIACGVPVLVSEDTGMKELIGSSRHGLVLPTGDLDALTEAIDAAYRGELFNR